MLDGDGGGGSSNFGILNSSERMSKKSAPTWYALYKRRVGTYLISILYYVIIKCKEFKS